MLTEVLNINLLEPSGDLLEPSDALRTIWELTPVDPGNPKRARRNPGSPLRNLGKQNETMDAIYFE